MWGTTWEYPSPEQGVRASFGLPERFWGTQNTTRY